MPRHLCLALLLAIAAPTAGRAQDFCAVLNAALGEMVEARSAVTEASDAVRNFRFRLGEDRRTYRDDIAALATPSQSADSARNQMDAAIGAMNDLRARRCPAIPDGR